VIPRNDKDVCKVELCVWAAKTERSKSLCDGAPARITRMGGVCISGRASRAWASCAKRRCHGKIDGRSGEDVENTKQCEIVSSTRQQRGEFYGARKQGVGSCLVSYSLRGHVARMTYHLHTYAEVSWRPPGPQYLIMVIRM
jgi:hypothetical protein